jgi:transcription initiation factor IIF auxiliary subunit
MILLEVCVCVCVCVRERERERGKRVLSHVRFKLHDTLLIRYFTSILTKKP